MDKRLIEAILFASGKGISEEDIARMINVKDMSIIKKALKQLKKDYDARRSPIMVVQDGDLWKLTVREEFMPVVRNLVSETELKKSVMETLAVIAWRQPIRQSELIDIRSTKAYDHVKLLEAKGFIQKQRQGRTYVIKLTPKFYEYFEIEGKEGVEKLFKNYAKELKNRKPAQEPEPDHLGRLEVYKVDEPQKQTEQGLEIYDEQDISDKNSTYNQPSTENGGTKQEPSGEETSSNKQVKESGGSIGDLDLDELDLSVEDIESLGADKKPKNKND